MSNQQAKRDDNRVPALLGHSSINDPSETRRVVVSDTGSLITDDENASKTFTYEDGKLTKITKSIKTINYEKTLTYDGDKVVAISAWIKI